VSAILTLDSVSAGYGESIVVEGGLFLENEEHS